MEAEYIIEQKIKRLENMKISYKKLFQKIDQNIIFLQEKQQETQNYYRRDEGENFFIIDLLNGENFEELPEDSSSYYNIGYVSMRYCDVFYDSHPQQTKDPVWNERFRL